MAKINIEYNREDIIQLILKDLFDKMPGVEFLSKDIEIMVKTKQNWKAEWENGFFQAMVNHNG